jgi:hypothetical protein
VITAIDEAVTTGARQRPACRVVGIDPRTLQRWQAADGGTDQRRGPHTPPGNALTSAERQRVLDLANRPEFRDLAPAQIVPRLADQGIYTASESTFYRVLHAADQQLSCPPLSKTFLSVGNPSGHSYAAVSREAARLIARCSAGVRQPSA